MNQLLKVVGAPYVAIGIFENRVPAAEILRDLGLTRSGIRTLSAPGVSTEDVPQGPIDRAGFESGPGYGTSTARTDFEVNLVRDLMAMGVTREEAQDYRDGIHRGGTLVIAQGPDDTADAAAEVMNRRGALHVKEMLRARASGASVQHSHEETAGMSYPEGSVQTGRDRSSSGGARVFVW